MLRALTATLWLILGGVAHAQPVRVTHHGLFANDQVRWEVRWTADTPTKTLKLTSPLPDGSTVHGQASSDVASGSLSFLGPADTEGGFVVTVPQPQDAQALYIPLLDGTAVQRVTLDGIDFEPDPSMGLEKHIKYWAHPTMGGSVRRDFERANRRAGGERAHTRDQAIYLRASPAMIAARGIPGTLSPPGRVSSTTQWVLILLTGGLLAFGAVLYRSLDRLARAERNQAYIHRNFGDGA